jgi:hypothetical protein
MEDYKKVKEFRVSQECSACKGSGVYVGFAEKDGYAVVCNRCKGTGCEVFVHRYTDFTKRKVLDNVKIVLEANPGIFVGCGEGFNFGGIPYEEWLRSGKFPEGAEMRNYVCPAWWYQLADYKRKPEWAECIKCGAFSDCGRFSNKAKCWERFDREHKTK